MNTHTIQMTPELEALIFTSTPRSRYWILDAVVNRANGSGDDVSEAADDFVSENGPGSHLLANAILAVLGEEPVFCDRRREGTSIAITKAAAGAAAAALGAMGGAA